MGNLNFLLPYFIFGDWVAVLHITTMKCHFCLVEFKGVFSGTFVSLFMVQACKFFRHGHTISKPIILDAAIRSLFGGTV